VLTTIALAVAVAASGPSHAAPQYERWECDGHVQYSIGDGFVARDEPPLLYRIMQNNDVGVVAVLWRAERDADWGTYVGAGVFLLRRSDGALLRFGDGLYEKRPKWMPPEANGPKPLPKVHCHKL